MFLGTFYRCTGSLPTVYPTILTCFGLDMSSTVFSNLKYLFMTQKSMKETKKELWGLRLQVGECRPQPKQNWRWLFPSPPRSTWSPSQPLTPESCNYMNRYNVVCRDRIAIIQLTTYKALKSGISPCVTQARWLLSYNDWDLIYRAVIFDSAV